MRAMLGVARKLRVEARHSRKAEDRARVSSEPGAQRPTIGEVERAGRVGCQLSRARGAGAQ
jgi:hypothetical protein